ncbi:MAG: zinc ribbon domain-containing protein [Gemmatimonadota bacterium]
MSRKLPLAQGETSRTACARALIRAGVDEETGEILSSAALVERVGWCADLVAGMTSSLVAGHWNTGDVEMLASGVDAGGRKLPSNAWMALRRLGWTTAAPEGVKVNDRIVRMAQEQAGRAVRSVKWRADLAAGILAAWPADPRKRTPEEWEQVRKAIAGGEYLPSSVIRSRTRQVAAFERKHGRLPADLFELEPVARMARMLLLAACDGQQATVERSGDGRRALLRLQLPTRPDPQKYADWSWVACQITLPPTIPANAVIHLPTLRIAGGKVHAAETGIAVVTVPPRNTSKHCPHCLTPLRHRKAPDRPAVSGWKWAICPNGSCGWQSDRDQGAWRRIAARGLTHQTKTVVDKASGTMVIRSVAETMESKAVITAEPKTSRADRSKTGTTRPRTNRLTPRRREVPSPVRPSGHAGQRPEGHAPTDRTRLPRAAHRHQGVTTISTPTSRHWPHGAALGAGFHLHAHASPPRWAEPTPDTTSCMSSLS